jgi:hypothetical protein
LDLNRRRGRGRDKEPGERERERERERRCGAVKYCSEKIKCFIEENDYFVLIIIVLN